MIWDREKARKSFKGVSLGVVLPGDRSNGAVDIMLDRIETALREDKMDENVLVSMWQEQCPICNSEFIDIIEGELLEFTYACPDCGESWENKAEWEALAEDK